MKKSYIIKLVFLLFIITLEVSSQNFAPEIEWQKTFGGSANDAALDVKQTRDGGFVVAGYTHSDDGDVVGFKGVSDFWILKLNSLGAIEWQKSLGGSGRDWAKSIQQTNDGGYIVVGQSLSNDGDATGGVYRWWVVKLNNFGIIEWHKKIGGFNDEVNSVVQTNDGGFVLAGSARLLAGSPYSSQVKDNFWIIKLDGTGNIVWNKHLGGNGYEVAKSIQQTNDGGFILTGYSTSSDGVVSHNNGGQDFWIVKTDSEGDIEWEKALGGSRDEVAYSIKQTRDGGYVVAGYTRSNNGYVTGNNGGQDFWIVKLDGSGLVDWQRALGGSNDDVANSIWQTIDGGYIVAGHSSSNNGDVAHNFGDDDFWIVKLSDEGQVEWKKSLGGSQGDRAHAIQQTTDRGFIIAGYSSSNDGDVLYNNGGQDFWVMKLSYPASNIYGNVFNDVGNNCNSDSSEYKLPNFILRQTAPIQRVVSSDSLGVFRIPTFDTLIHDFEPIIPQYLEVLYQNNCTESYSLKIDVLGTDTSSFDFGFQIEPCPLLLVDIGSNRRRPCFKSSTFISFRNEGTIDENNVEVIVVLPDSVYPISASHPYLINNEGHLVFEIGNLNSKTSGIITIIDSMACDLSLSNTQACSFAWISPVNSCYNNLLNLLPWDSSQIIVNGGIFIDDSDTCYRFVIENVGASMEDFLTFDVYSGISFLQRNSFLLGKNDSLVVLVCGTDYAQILVNQHPSNPQAKFAYLSPPTNDSTVVYIYEYINIDQKLESAIECLTVVNAYDPNDKNVTPSGWGNNNFVSPSALLDYKIRFQNTGNDTAYNIVLIDTINATVFDVSKLILGGSSHPYRFEASGDYGDVVFYFYFDNINLLDSMNHEPYSHGFVNFKIGAHDNIQQGTIAKNFVDIYFDFNPPIRTNTSMVTLKDTLLFEGNSVTVRVVGDGVRIEDGLRSKINWKIYPNPTSSSFNIEISELNNLYSVGIKNIMGQTIHSEKVQTNQTLIDASKWSNGIYFISLKDEKGVLKGMKKIIINN
jgi:hypothetical protein